MPDEIDEVLKFDPGNQSDNDEIAKVLQFDPGPSKSERQTPEQIVSEDNKMSWREALVSAVENIPGSAVQFGKDIIQPIMHPVETAKAVGNIAKGAVEKIPGASYMTPGPAYDVESEKPRGAEFDAMVDFFSDRYGSVENFKKTVAKDPVGLLADIATVMTGAGKVIEGAGALSKTGAVSKVGKTMAEVGSASEPVNIAKAAASLPAKALPKKVPTNMYLSSAKFGTTIPRAERIKMANLALEKGIMPTVAGLDKIRNKIDELNTSITGKIDAAVTAGEKIPVDELFKDFKELKKEYSLSGQPIKNWRAIDRIRSEIKTANTKMGRTDLTPAEAQQLKQKIYKELESHYSKVKESGASVKAQKAVARAAKEAIEDIIPEIKNLNKYEGSLIELRHSIERSAARITNRDIIGIGTPIKATMGGVAGGYPGAIGGTILGILDTPRVKAKIAIVLNRLKKKGVKVDEKAVLARMATFQAGRSEEVIKK